MDQTRANDPEDLTKLHEFIQTLPNVKQVDVLPYHTMGVYKWKEMGIRYPLEGIEAPEAEVVALANQILETSSYK